MSVAEALAIIGSVVGTVVAVMAGVFVILRFVVDSLRSEMRGGFESVHRRLDGLDGDVTTLTDRVMGSS